MSRDNIKNLIFAIAILVGIGAALFLIFNVDNKNDKVEIEVKGKNSNLVSKDPKESAANFIMANGSIGNLEELSEKDLTSGNLQETVEMRLQTLDKVKDAIVDDSPIISGDEEEASWLRDGLFPVYYSIRNLKVGEPYGKKKVRIEHNQIGSVEYNSIKVNVDFDSVETVFTWPTDLQLKAVLTRLESTDSFKNVAIELVEIDGLWYIYDVENIEYLLNVRMATWDGRGSYDVSSDEAIVAKEYEIDMSNFLEGSLFQDVN